MRQAPSRPEQSSGVPAQEPRARRVERADPESPRVRAQQLGDAGAHVGLICDGAGPTYLLKHWARDRQRGPRLPLELLVSRSITDWRLLLALVLLLRLPI